MPTRISIEVRLAILFVILISPETNWHRGVGPRAYQFTWHGGVLDVFTIDVEDLDCHSQRLALQFYNSEDTCH